MPTIRLETSIEAPREKVFDLARSIDTHVASTAQTNEKAVAGKTSGLIELGEWVTWEAKHFGIVQRLTSKVTEMAKPKYFVDEMVSGAFKSFKHEHTFEENDAGTIMIDIFSYISPYGIFGQIADKLFLKRYMTNLLALRNQIIKAQAEEVTPNQLQDDVPENYSPDFIAILTYLTTEEGGRKTPALTGYRPTIKFPFEVIQTSGKQVFLGTAAAFPGDTIESEITIISKKHFVSRLSEGMNFQFKEGDKLIGTGVIKQILNKSLKEDVII
ncbi:MAG: hypothetical protein V4687_15040 [Bacteroidota bacterium]